MDYLQMDFGAPMYYLEVRLEQKLKEYPLG